MEKQRRRNSHPPSTWFILENAKLRGFPANTWNVLAVASCLTRSDIGNVFQQQNIPSFPTGTKPGLVSVLLRPGCDRGLNSWEKWSRERRERGWKDKGGRKNRVEVSQVSSDRRFPGI